MKMILPLSWGVCAILRIKGCSVLLVLNDETRIHFGVFVY